MEFFADDLRLTIKIILIDMILSADNAIVIGLVASQFDPKIRQKVLIIGTSLAVLFRILFAVLVAWSNFIILYCLQTLRGYFKR
jgi:predicted tellurium resistance membrane protein TerC